MSSLGEVNIFKILCFPPSSVVALSITWSGSFTPLTLAHFRMIFSASLVLFRDNSHRGDSGINLKYSNSLDPGLKVHLVGSLIGNLKIERIIDTCYG